MAISRSYSAQLNGLNPEIITIEVDISIGLHSFSIVGLGDRSIDEAKDRISAAIKNSGYTSPKQKNQKIIISLAPADIRKEGSSFDLGMSMAYLLASKELFYIPDDKIFLGELSLHGHVSKISGILPILSKLKSLGYKEAYIPASNLDEAILIRDIDIYPISTLSQLIEHFQNKNIICKIKDGFNIPKISTANEKDMSIVRGNDIAKRGLEIAAAGAHNVVLYGPPGTGKTLLAHCFRSILPDLTYSESIEVTGIHSIVDHNKNGLITRPPFRSPHHTASYPSVVGGGTYPKPGEITLAHRGVLFLDEFPEFDTSVIEALRQPLEEQTITISRAKGVVTFPAQTIFIASLNPCPCGMKGSDKCKCSSHAISTYNRKFSGPIADRIDLWLSVDKIDYDKLGQTTNTEEKSETIRSRVQSARNIQRMRFIDRGINKLYNSELNSSDIEKIIEIDDESRKMLIDFSKRLKISARSFHRIIKVARTIADLSDKKQVDKQSILESIQYRSKII